MYCDCDSCTFWRITFYTAKSQSTNNRNGKGRNRKWKLIFSQPSIFFSRQKSIGKEIPNKITFVLQAGVDQAGWEGEEDQVQEAGWREGGHQVGAPRKGQEWINFLYVKNKLETPCDFFKRAIVNSLKISVNYCQKYSCHQKLYFQYNIDKPANEEDYEDEDEDEDGFTGILIFHGRIHQSYPIFNFQKVCQ